MSESDDHVVVVPAPGSRRATVVARCSCGWAGSPVGHDWARKQAERHVDEMTEAAAAVDLTDEPRTDSFPEPGSIEADRRWPT
ncbi:MAG TPA: hypothetical protein VG435_16270 [Acidimicrobiales bacterium]|nr:hypothetical protein [Acidimicrobiales bacterium]